MATLCAGTPTITVRDNRGLDVRSLRYNRSVEGDGATQYVDAQTHNARGQPTSSQDPRFFGSETRNFHYTPTLSGQLLQTVSVDAGTAKACADIAGQPIWQHSQGRDCNIQSDNNISVQLYYDALGRPVQRNRVTSDVSTADPVSDTSDIWCYGDYSGPPGATYDPTDTTDPRNANQRGQVFQRFDTAGLIDMSVLGYAVQGTALRQDRRFLATACDSTTHWRPALPPALYDLNKQWLEPDSDPDHLYSTRWSYDALGQILTQVDAKGHQQQTAYDCAGRKRAASVTPMSGTLTPVTTAIIYNATGAMDTRSDANNIQIAYAYEPQTTQRLTSITATRVSIKLQALTYAYDGVGNVIALFDNSASAQVTFFSNRAVTPDRGYTYDALYQLTSATGRENYVNNTPKGTDWPGAQFSPTNTPDYQAYTRSYNYDLGGNLTRIGSSNWSGAAPPTRQLVVGNTSNRAVSTANNPGATQTNIDTYFDPAGKSICLDANRNQPMYWTAFHQLYCVVTTYRTPTVSPGIATGNWSNSDREQYAYDGNGQRVRKYASSMASGNWNYLDTRYLPGLELRDNTATGENLEVIVLDDGARLLNWAGGAEKPGDIPNLQLRYQYSDRQNSCQIETDKDGNVITQEEYYPYGGTAVLASRGNSEVKYKYIRYSGQERDATGLYYYGLRYYQPWIGRWINPDLAGSVDGQNLYCMVRNNPVTLKDRAGLMADTGQGQAQQTTPIRPELPTLPRHSERVPLERALGWEDNKVLSDTDWDGDPGATLVIRNRDLTATNLWHKSDPQHDEKKPVFSDKGRLTSTIQHWIKSAGLTVIRTVGHAYGKRGNGHSAAASFSLPTFVVDGEVKRLPHETWVNLVLPLAGAYNSKNEANSIENLAKIALKNPSELQTLAKSATFALAVHRTVQKDPQWKINHTTPGIWELRKQVTNAYEKLTDSLDFKDHQKLLFDHLRDPDKLGDVLARVKDGDVPATAMQASSSRPVVLGKRKIDPAGEIAPSEITAPSAAAGQSNATAAAVAAIPYVSGAHDTQSSSAATFSSIDTWLRQYPTPYDLQSLPYGNYQDAAGPSQAPGFSRMPGQQAMPAQQASALSPPLHDQPLSQRQQVQLSEQQNPNSRTPSPFPNLDLADFNGLLTDEEMRWVEQAQRDLQPFGQQNPFRRTPSPHF